ncbi:calcium-binding protein [Pseudomonas fluorescens]|uniref:Calcium-binding protein n=1 Tax=Pseudomonas fluorescens TaxID=294 RepID=A0A944HDM1_PSEFL|nr:calcium-binding protein [Pseudomonas fluorescens]MBT2293840.1 calcium-binding protein [Pseudomonas fluorescens]MBT2307503.1 calcium-binding protein [Pseudomonas fluorescens]MBT2311436.1 calcium-binding protein [Pseudomonas fluorescens]MBT2319509.1 calcium-binding protein [Pseudomonas fluorescens]MBT2330476.1 calcium-binding protein [Pseudomonas fluorescens]
MAQIFQPAPVPDDYAVVITDLGVRTNNHAVETLDFKTADGTQPSSEHKHRQAQLEIVDKLYGPIHIGSVTVTRSALDALGATTDGQPLNGDNTFFRSPTRFFVNSLQFSATDIETRIKLTADANDYRLPTLLFEMASLRSPAARPLLRETPEAQAEPASHRRTLEKLLKSAQRLDIQGLSHRAFSWANTTKSNVLIPTGLGLQAFGIYSGLRGLQDAIRNKDSYQTIFNGTSVAAEVASIGVEAAVTRQASQMIRAGQRSLEDFAKTTFATRLARGSGLIASVLTLPFDVIAAVDSFKAAAHATGKEATDHYVSAALSVTSAAMTLTIGVAALAGFGSAGPAGLAAGLILVVGSQIWGAIRQVDEIDDYIDLTVQERLRTGWLAFWTISPDQDIQDRYTIAKATAGHSKLLQANALNLLKGPLKDSTEAIVNGKFTVELEPVTYNTWNWWTGERYQATTVRPRIKDNDDRIDARSGVTAETPGAVVVSSAEHKGIHWYIGGGDDTVLGAEDKPNVFHCGAGVKQLTGGTQDDVFIFEGTTETRHETHSRLVGGMGNDTLVLSGRASDREKPRLGYEVDLDAGQVSFITHTSPDTESGHSRHAELESIENVEIPEGGANIIKGTAGPNIIKSRGNDSIEAGAGDDRIYILSGNNRNADGGPGEDIYAVAHKPGHVSITEDGVNNSVIALDWRADLIQSWRIEEGHLVMTSCFDASDWALRKVTLRDVYEDTDYPKALQNNRLTFITQDGYHLVPDLPDTIESSSPLDIETVVVQQGTPRNPAILADRSEQQISHAKDTSYHVSHFNELSTLKVKQKSEFSTTLHLDYTHAELTRIEAYYTAHVTQKDEGDSIKYGECGLTLHFGVRRVVLKNLASSDERYSAQNPTTGRRAFSTLGSHHTFILIMNDGSSYRLIQPSPDYGLLLDETFIGKDPVQWKTDVPLPLTPTKKKYAYLPPLDQKPYYMRRWATCAMLTSPTEQAGIEVLIGEGSTYLVHLSPNMTLRLSTPGALAGAHPRLPRASLWELDATQLGQVEIKLSAHLLRMGGTTIHLPAYEAEDLVDPIRVITAQGVVYAVDSLFERVYVEALDGRYFAPLTAANTALSSELSSLTSEELKVLHVALKDGSPGTLSYNLRTRRWILDSDKSRVIEAADLKKTDLCDHSLKIYQDLAREGLNQTPPLGDDTLRLLREKCVELIESYTLDNSVMFARALALSAVFGIRLSQLSWFLSLAEASPEPT